MQPSAKTPTKYIWRAENIRFKLVKGSFGTQCPPQCPFSLPCTYWRNDPTELTCIFLIFTTIWCNYQESSSSNEVPKHPFLRANKQSTMKPHVWNIKTTKQQLGLPGVDSYPLHPNNTFGRRVLKHLVTDSLDHLSLQTRPKSVTMTA